MNESNMENEKTPLYKDSAAKREKIASVLHLGKPNAKTLWKRLNIDRKSTRLNSSHIPLSRMPSSA